MTKDILRASDSRQFAFSFYMYFLIRMKVTCMPSFEVCFPCLYQEDPDEASQVQRVIMGAGGQHGVSVGQQVLAVTLCEGQ